VCPNLAYGTVPKASTLSMLEIIIIEKLKKEKIISNKFEKNNSNVSPESEKKLCSSLDRLETRKSLVIDFSAP